MKLQKAITVSLCVLFVISLVLTVFVAALSASCTPKAVERRLARQGFYELAADRIRIEVEGLQSVIGIPTEDVLQTIPDDTIKSLLKPYVLAVSEQLLCGSTAPAEIDFQSDGLYALVCEVITEQQYGGDTAQMAEDRAAAYADLRAAVNDTLSFFPTTLFDTAMNILAKDGASDTVYAAIRLLRKLVVPCIVLTLLCGGGILLYGRKDLLTSLKTLAGCWSVTAALLFFSSLFAFVGNHLLDRFSLSDGLLRRYVLALFDNAAAGIITVTAITFALGVALLAVAIVFIAVKTPCADEKTVVE